MKFATIIDLRSQVYDKLHTLIYERNLPPAYQASIAADLAALNVRLAWALEEVDRNPVNATVAAEEEEE